MFKVFQIETIILGVWTDLPKLPKIPNLLFLQHFKKKLSDAGDFYRQIGMKVCKKLMRRFFDVYAQAFPKFSK